MKSLAIRLKESRNAVGLTQGQLAKKAKVSQSLIGNLESNNQKSTSKIAQIAAILGIDALWLATGKGEPNNKKAQQLVATYEVPPSPITPEEQAMLDTIRKLTKDQRNELLRSAEETQQKNAHILAELAGKEINGPQ